MIVNCKNKSRGLKIFLGILLAVNIIFSASFALGADDKSKQLFSPFELSYPNIPGLGRLSDYQNVTTSQQVGFIISYIFKLVFFISIGAGLVALIASGVFYIVSSSRPRYLTLAKKMASNAMLGLFILLCAYILLYFINPQLLSLTLQKPDLDTSVLLADSSTPNTITLAQIPFTEKLTEAVDNLSEKVYVNDKGKYYEQLNVKDGLKWCLTDGYGGAVTDKGNSIAGLPVVEPLAVDPNKTIKESGCVDPGKKSADKYVYKAEIQLRQTAEIVGKAAVILQDKVNASGDVIEPGLESLLAKCRCGEAFKYVDWKVGNLTKPECKAGLISDSKNSATMKIYTDALAKGMCFTQCKTCWEDIVSIPTKGNAFVCDLRDVRKTKNGVYQACILGNGVGTCNPENKTETCWVAIPEVGFIPINPLDEVCYQKGGLNIQTIDPKNLIKWKTLQILELQTELEAKSRLSGGFLDSVLLVARALDVNKIDFLISGAKDASFGYDTQAKIEQWTKEGKNVALLDYGSVSENTQSPIPPVAPLVDSSQPKGFLAKIKAWFAPLEEKFKMGFNPFVSAVEAVKIKLSLKAGTAYYVVNDTTGTMNSEVVAINAALFRDGERFNLFSVLTDLTLEDIEGVFKQCLVAAFGEGDYRLNKEQIDSIVKSAMNSGSADHLRAVMKGILDKMAQAITDGAKDGAGEEAALQIIAKFFGKCESSGCSYASCTGAPKEINNCKDNKLKVIMKELKTNNCGVDMKSAIANTCCYCIKNLKDNGISPNFVSDTISGLLTKDLGDVLPLVQNELNTKTLDILFPPDQPDKHISKFLKGDTVDAYNAILNGALTKPFDEQIPSLGVLLNKPMEKVLPEFISNINTGFINAVSSTKHYIKKYQEDYLKGLAAQFIEKPLSQWAENWFDRAGIGTKNLPIEACFEKLRDGYIYQGVEQPVRTTYNYDLLLYKADPIKNPRPEEPGQCVKMTADMINRLLPFSLDQIDVPKAFVYGDVVTEDLQKIEGVNFYKVDPKEVKTICETATYSWGASYSLKNASGAGDLVPERPKQTGDKTYACYPTNNGVSDIKGAIETVQDQEKMKMKNYLAGGLVNYAEKLGIALTQTAMQFALAYGRVYIEDHLVSRLIGEWNAITNFQEGMAKFMKSSVKDVLPNSISDALQSNIKAEIKHFCDNYKDAREKAYGTDLVKKADNSCALKDLENPSEMWINVANMVVTLPGGFKVNDKAEVAREKFCVSQKVGDKICQLEEHLDSTVLDEIKYLFCDTRYTGDDSRWGDMCDSFFKSLNIPLKDALKKICYTPDEGKQICLDIGDWFNKSIAGMLFPEIKNIKDLIETSPKEVICGQHLTSDGTNVSFSNDPGKYVEKQCWDVFSNKFGLIPQITTDQTKLNAVKNIMPWCYFINNGCKNPVLTLPCTNSNTVGGLIKCVVSQNCSLLNTRLALNPGGQCFCKHSCPNGNILSNLTQKGACNVCDTLDQNSVFYTWLSTEMEVNMKNISSAGIFNSSDLKKVEQEIYLQMYNIIGSTVLGPDIKAVASNRGINWSDVEIAKSSKIVEYVATKDYSKLFQIIARVFVDGNSFKGTANIKDVFKKDEFLGATPYTLLKTKVCPSIIASFQENNNKFTFENVEAECLDKVRTSGYTMGSTESCTLAETIGIISSNVVGSEGYILCKILENTPQEIAGLDQKLRNYIQPKEYIILFDLLNDKLSEGTPNDCRPKEKFYYENGQAMCCDPTMGIGRGVCYWVGERPAGLNNVLDFMSAENPITALRDVQQSMPTSETGLYTFVDIFNKNGSNCLGSGTTISGCSSPLPYILEAMGIDATAKFEDTTEKIKIYDDDTYTFFDFEYSSFRKITGKFAEYYFVQPITGNNLTLVYKKPDSQASKVKDDLDALLDFMQTPIGSMLSSSDEMGKTKILDIICNEITGTLQTEEEWPAGQTICDLDLFAEANISKLGIIKEKLLALLKQTPTQLMQVYLKNDLPNLFKKLSPKASIIDALSANTAFDQPMVNTLFKVFDGEKPFKDGTDWIEKKAKILDASIMKGVEVGQDAIDYTLTDVPMRIGGSAISFLSEAIGIKKATEITGTGCYSIETEASACKSEADIKRTVTVGAVKKYECCTFAKAQACTPRCRIVDSKTTQCNILLGEDPLPESNAGIFGDGTYRRCCFKLITNGALNQCQRCRAVNFDAKAKCRKADENGMGEEREDRDNNTCCSLESRESPLVVIKDEDITSKDKWIEAGGSCCTTVSQCISNRLSSHLENLAEMMADGYVRLGSLKK